MFIMYKHPALEPKMANAHLWEKDQVFHVWKCTSCGAILYGGIPNPWNIVMITCDEFMVKDVQDS